MTFIAMIIVTMRRSPLIIMTAGPPGRQGAAAGVGVLAAARAAASPAARILISGDTPVNPHSQPLVRPAQCHTIVPPTQPGGAS